jgi:hypothetical protein
VLRDETAVAVVFGAAAEHDDRRLRIDLRESGFRIIVRNAIDCRLREIQQRDRQPSGRKQPENP